MTLPTGLASLSGADPLVALRAYRALAPWSLRDLASLAGALLEASNIVPVNAAARALPGERTIRFYVARGLVSPPEGRGTAATYGYRHLLQVLVIKLRQMMASSSFFGMTLLTTYWSWIGTASLSVSTSPRSIS